MDRSAERIDKAVEDIFSLYEKFGREDYIGEPVSQIEHMSQSAQLAIDGGSDDALVLAAFFHDIGHLCVSATSKNSMGGYGIKSHEQIGAAFLKEKGFPERVFRLVENHVQAKRYLTYRFHEYYDSLSEASKKTLEFQGGRMTEEEALNFESDPLFDASIQLRKWDELAKEKHVPLIPMEVLKEHARQVLARS